MDSLGENVWKNERVVNLCHILYKILIVFGDNDLPR